MSGNAEQLVYQVSVDLGSSMNKVTDLRKGFEDAKKSIESVNSQEVHNIVDPAESSRVLTLSQRLAEVKKALDLISQGYSLKVGTNDIDNAEAKLRSLEKLYGDMQKSMKDGMLSNVSDQAAKQNRNALDEVYNAQQRGIKESATAHRAAWNDMTQSVQNYEKQCTKATVALSNGGQKTAEWEKQTVQSIGNARAEMEKFGATSAVKNPMDGFNLGAYNQQTAASNAMAWDTRGITSYTSEIGKLQRAQESLYAVYKQDPSAANLANFSATTARLKEVSDQYRVYQRSIQNTGSAMDQFMVKARSHLAWIASGFTIAALFTVPKETVDTMERLESEMASIKQVMPEIEGKDDSSIAKYNSEMQKFIGIASQYGEAVDHVMDAARSIGRMYGQGDSGIANTNLMTQQAAKMATADAFDMTTATKALEASMAQWGLQTQDTSQLMVNSNRILDTWTITAHRGAASAQDIGNAIEAAGTAAAQAGISFEFFNALVETGVRATGRSGSEIGQAIKSMMVSMQTDKSVRALQQWGISLDEVGEDGVKRMRSMEDVILDVSMAINSTDKDTSKLLMTLSGGKYQYSKVSAMLKDYKELLRMMGIINSDDTAGFTTKQVEVQMDTLKRKMQTIKDDLQSGVMGVGANGGLSALKSIADHIDNIVVGLNKMDSTGAKAMASLVVGVVALKGFDKFSRSVMTTIESIKLLNAQSAISQATDSRSGIVKQWLTTRYVDNTRAAAAAKLASRGLVVAQEAESAGDIQSIFLKAQRTAALARMTAAERIAATATSTLTATTRGLSAVMGALGGPVGIALTALSILVPTLLLDADAEGSVAKSAKDTSDSIDNLIASSQQEYNQSQRKIEVCTSLVKKYNDIKDSLSGVVEGSDEYIKKTTELGTIEDTVKQIVGDSAIKFDENGKIKISSITDVLEKEKEAAINKIEQEKQKLIAEQVATDGSVIQTKRRIDTMKEEAKALGALGNEYDWLYGKIGNTLIWAADKMDSFSKELFGHEEAVFGAGKQLVSPFNLGIADSLRNQGNQMLIKLQNGDRGAASQFEGELQILSNNVEKTARDSSINADKISKLTVAQQTIRDSGNGNNKDLTARKEADDNDYGQTKESGEPKSTKEEKTPKQYWEYGDKATQAMLAVTQQSDVFEKYGVNMERLVAVVSKVTGNDKMKWSGDIFGMGASNEWDSAFAFATKLNDILSTGKSNLGDALQQIYGGDGAKAWNHLVDNEMAYFTEKAPLDFKKYARRFDDPNSPSGGGSGNTTVDKIIAAAEKYGVDRTLALQVGKVESGYNQGAVSPAGAIGVMQLMPGTAASLGVNPHDETQNIDGGIRYLKQQLSDFGDTRKALAAYNAGPGNISAGMGYADTVMNTDVSDAVQSGVTNALNGEGTTWVKQTSAASMEGTLPQTQQALEMLGKWYKKQTGNPLVLIAGTNGSHAGGPTSHAAGYKVDVNSFMNGIDGRLETDAAFRERFREYGHQLGLGMSDEGDHIDVQTTGYEWTTKQNYGGFHASAQQQQRSRWNWLGMSGGLNGVQRDYVAEEESFQAKRKEAYEQIKKDLELRKKYEGDTADIARQTLINESIHAADLESNADYWDRMYKSMNDKVWSYIQGHAGVKDALHGSQWHDLTDQEQTEVANKTNDKDFQGLTKWLQESSKQRKTARGESDAARYTAMQSAGYMSPTEESAWNISDADNEYQLKVAELSANKRLSGDSARRQAEIAMLERKQKSLHANTQSASNQYETSQFNDSKEQGQLASSITDLEKQITKIDPKDVGELRAKNEQLRIMKDTYRQLGESGSDATKKLKDGFDKAAKAEKDNADKLKEIKDQYLDQIKQKSEGMFEELIVDGKSFKEILNDLWKQLARMALQQAFGMSSSGNIWASLFGLGGKANGGKFASGGHITGAGTGKSDSILAYIANKDKFAYLSNGEYVMTAEATKRIGVNNLDALNGYADGGALSPTPYVPSINPTTAKKAMSINGNSDTVALLKEQNAKMAEQLTLLKGMGKDGSNGGITVLNTQASSADVLKALQENPRAVQALMGQQRRAGFR